MRKRIDKDLEVTIRSNVRGDFYYQNTNQTVIIELENYGDEDFITFSGLKQMAGRNKALLEGLKVLIVDVEANDDDITVSDIIRELKLEDSYNEISSLVGVEEFENVQEEIPNFITDGNTSQFEKTLNSKKSKVANILIEEAVHQYKQGNLKDYNKMEIIAKAIGRSSEETSTFWEDVRATKVK